VEIVAYGKYGVVWNRICRRGSENTRAPKILLLSNNEVTKMQIFSIAEKHTLRSESE